MAFSSSISDSEPNTVYSPLASGPQPVPVFVQYTAESHPANYSSRASGSQPTVLMSLLKPTGNQVLPAVAHGPSYFVKAARSPWSYIAMTAAFLALLVIGILASTGVLNAMGTANASYLSYGMYAGAGGVLIAACLFCCVRRRSLSESL